MKTGASFTFSQNCKKSHRPYREPLGPPQTSVAYRNGAILRRGRRQRKDPIRCLGGGTLRQQAATEGTESSCGEGEPLRYSPERRPGSRTLPPFCPRACQLSAAVNVPARSSQRSSSLPGLGPDRPARSLRWPPPRVLRPPKIHSSANPAW